MWMTSHLPDEFLHPWFELGRLHQQHVYYEETQAGLLFIKVPKSLEKYIIECLWAAKQDMFVKYSAPAEL